MLKGACLIHEATVLQLLKWVFKAKYFIVMDVFTRLFSVYVDYFNSALYLEGLTFITHTAHVVAYVKYTLMLFELILHRGYSILTVEFVGEGTSKCSFSPIS